MTNDSLIAPKTARIVGTLHRRGTVPPAPLQDENLPREQAEEREVAGRAAERNIPLQTSVD